MKICSKCFDKKNDNEMTEISGLSVCFDCLEKIKKSKPKEYTTKEVQEKLIKHLWGVLEYWYSESSVPSTRDKMEGLLFSILSTLDGSSVGMPGFKMIPSVEPSDKKFHIEFGENWYNDEEDIGGYLHELLHRFGPTEDDKTTKQEE